MREYLSQSGNVVENRLCHTQAIRGFHLSRRNRVQYHESSILRKFEFEGLQRATKRAAYQADSDNVGLLSFLGGDGTHPFLLTALCRNSIIVV